MLVVTKDGTATIATPDGVLHTLPYTDLGRADMMLQAKYHRWCREHEYRRVLHCNRCGEDFDVDSEVDDAEATWKMLMVCRCRAFYGTISLKELASAMRNWASLPNTSAAS